MVGGFNSVILVLLWERGDIGPQGALGNAEQVPPLVINSQNKGLPPLAQGYEWVAWILSKSNTCARGKMAPRKGPCLPLPGAVLETQLGVPSFPSSTCLLPWSLQTRHKETVFSLVDPALGS